MKFSVFILFLFLPYTSQARLIDSPELTLQMVSSCADQLQGVRPKLSRSISENLCRQADASCLVEVAARHPKWDSFSLRHACQVPQKKSFDHDCITRAEQNFNFVPTELGNFCRDQRSECMLTYKEARPETSKAMTDAACLFNMTNTCPALLAQNTSTQDWETLNINHACRYNKNEVCALELSQAMVLRDRTFGPTFLQLACKNIETTCPAFLVQEGKSWSATEINDICSQTEFSCVQTKLHWPELKHKNKLIAACLKKKEIKP